ncbi:hypothetical protein LTR86_005694 [Recurvomyces mirabilis]|nr:hypothetical protein LTR86_005694 [Recurvomyces mirabilis]
MQEDLTFEERERRREWNRSPLKDLFPRIPGESLETILNKAIDKPFAYNLSESKLWNSRRLTSIVVAHVRHARSDYDKLLAEGVERFEARDQTKDAVWKVLREWCPWDDSNLCLERCWKATLIRPEEWVAGVWDPMNIDDESEFEDDPMDID